MLPQSLVCGTNVYVAPREGEISWRKRFPPLSDSFPLRQGIVRRHTLIGWAFGARELAPFFVWWEFGARDLAPFFLFGCFCLINIIGNSMALLAIFYLL